MKTGVSSYSFRKHIVATKCNYIDICNIAKEMGFEGIEFVDLDNREFGITTDPMACARRSESTVKRSVLRSLPTPSALTFSPRILRRNMKDFADA